MIQAIFLHGYQKGKIKKLDVALRNLKMTGKEDIEYRPGSAVYWLEAGARERHICAQFTLLLLIGDMLVKLLHLSVSPFYYL